MCGFFITNDIAINEDHYNTINIGLKFRGPDFQSKLLSINGWKVYHSRLSIIGLDNNNNQPIIGEDGDILVFNGEILNYIELSKKYFDGSHQSDTRLLYQLIRDNKINLSELDGFFAFVYVDKYGDLKYCARDSFGVKPLFIYKNKDFISISSEPNVLANLYNLSVNTDAIQEYKYFRYPIISGSYFKSLINLTPGACLINGSFFNCHNYLAGEYEKRLSIEELENAIISSIHSRQISDAPAGLLLSGGIDSNLIRKFSSFHSYFTAGFPDDFDLDYANNIQNEEVIKDISNPEKFITIFNEMVKLRGEPLSVPNEVLLGSIGKIASKNGVKVLLSGEGADEFWGGYDRLYTWACKNNKFNIDEFLTLYAYGSEPPPSIIKEKVLELIESENHYSLFELVRWFFVKFHMPILFRRLDFSLMFAGIEGREPLATPKLFKIAAKFGPEQLLNNQLGKLPLRKISEKYFGANFSYTKKVGFPVPLSSIFRIDDNEKQYDIWFDKNLEALGWL